MVGFIDFRDANGERSPWFTRLVGCARKEPAYRPLPVRSLDEAERWLETQVAPTLAAVVAARGGDLTTLTDLLANGRARWGPQHLALIEQGRPPDRRAPAGNGPPVLTVERSGRGAASVHPR